ncbi:aldehyde dehydrogenase family protein [Streptococcus equi]|uniref:aldehyde dehydrogenase family protein n=1 Tax=Streptococcus equi TaxID=1336 RepID=UPI002032779E|nr:aldehyde dehydrogenase family protein [Streptococcus equi]
MRSYVVSSGTCACDFTLQLSDYLAGSKIAPALIAGNVVVLKPPTQGSISGLLLAEVFAEAGLLLESLIPSLDAAQLLVITSLSMRPVNFYQLYCSTPIGERIGN